MANKKNKNVSQSIKNGTIVQTRDEFFQGQKKYRKPGYGNKGNYRKAVVIDSNKNDDLALVKLSTKGNPLPDSVSKFKPFVETKDERNKPIRLSFKFIPTNSNLSNHSVAIIKQECFNSAKYYKKNKSKARALKSRK